MKSIGVHLERVLALGPARGELRLVLNIVAFGKAPSDGVKRTERRGRPFRLILFLKS